MFWFFGREACGILAPQPGIKPSPPALKGGVLTTGPPGKSHPLKLEVRQHHSSVSNSLFPSVLTMTYMVTCDLPHPPPTSDLILNSAPPCPVLPAYTGPLAVPQTCRTDMLSLPSKGPDSFFFLEYFCLRYLENSLFSTFSLDFITYSKRLCLSMLCKEKKALPSFYLLLFFTIVLTTYI